MMRKEENNQKQLEQHLLFNIKEGIKITGKKETGWKEASKAKVKFKVTVRVIVKVKARDSAETGQTKESPTFNHTK